MKTRTIIHTTIAGIARVAQPPGWGKPRSQGCAGPRWCRAGVFSALLLSAGVACTAAEGGASWPVADATCKPWAYNWWLGSAVDKANLTRELTRYRDAGLGGIHIIPIYGVKGAEARNIPYLSPKWMEMLAFAVREGKRLGLGVDMTTGTGWCFGGPNITPDMGGQAIKVSETGVEVRPTGAMVKRPAPGGEGLMINPFYGEAMRRYLERFTAAFAEQPSDARPQAMYHDSYEYFGAQWSPDLLEEFAKRRGYRLQDQWQLFSGKGDPDAVARVRADYKETVSDLMVEKVFPQWVQWSHDRGMLTRNQAHGSPANLLDLYALSDIPETEMFGRGKRDPLKSGLDARFAEGDRDPLVSKFASSAAHLGGKKRASAEYGTWMAEHFCETLEELKCFADRFFAAGINHVFYHGCVYSPDDAAWPGWLFYAATEMNPRNSIWHDAPVLNAYIARCQAVLQTGAPDNEVLLYWPIHDRWNGTRGLPENFAVHNSGQWLDSEPVGRVARQLWNQGIGFDYVSDRLLQRAVMTGSGEISFGESRYRAIMVPSATHMPLETVELLQKLARQGAKVLFVDRLPSDVPGFGNLESRRVSLARLLADKTAFRVGALAPLLAEVGITGEGVAQQPGTLLVRRRVNDGCYLFIANQSIKPLTGWFRLATPARSAAIMDPMTGQTGVATIRKSQEAPSQAEVYVRLEPGHSIILRTFADREIAGEPWTWSVAQEALLELKGPWQVTFKEGGPVLPKAYEAAELGSWTTNGAPETERFGGTAVYRKSFDFNSSQAASGDAGRCLLDLGIVKHSARVTLNGRSLGTLIMAPYEVRIPQGLLKATGNELLVEVTNLSANRIRDLDLRKVPWRNFKDINLVNYKYAPFDASKWPVFDSGLIGPVLLRTDRGGKID